MTTQTQISSGTKVKLHFSLALESGELVDSTFEGEPAELNIGDGQLPEGFENLLLGLHAGERKVFAVEPEQGFGAYNPANVQKLPRDQFTELTPEEGLVIGFVDANGGEVPGVVQSFDERWVMVDFNHPLAGKTLAFEVEIVAVA